MTTTIDPKIAAIALLNDVLRTTGKGGRIMITSGIQARGAAFIQAVVDAARAYSDFSPDNDPYGEHDCGFFEAMGEKLMFKIDYYDQRFAAGSEDPSNPLLTNRVMTMLLMEEY